MSEALIGAVSALLGGVLGFAGALLSGRMSASATRQAYEKADADLEKTYFRVQRAAGIHELIRMKYALLPNHPCSEQDITLFNQAVSSNPFLFSGDDVVMQSYDTFINDASNTDKFVALIKTMLKAEGIARNITDTHLLRSVTIARATQPH